MKKFVTLITFAFTVVKLYAQCSPCTVPFVASSQATGNSSSVTINKPNGVVQNDVMVAAIHVGWCNSGSAITPPNGWTLINSTSNTGSGCGTSNTSIQLATFYKVAGPSEPANYTFTGTTNQFYVGGIVAYSGVNTITPVEVSSNNGAQELCNNIVANSVTTTSSCTRLVAVFFCSVNNSLNNIVPQNSLTERVDVATTGNHPWGNENLEMSDEIMSTAGATGNKTAALSGCSGNGWVTGAQLIALDCQLSTMVNDPTLARLITVSPNPSSAVFNLSMSQPDHVTLKNISVYNVLGEEIYRSAPEKMTIYPIDLSNKPKGIYFLRVVLSEGIVTKKIVIE